MANLSAHFTEEEMTCKCGCKQMKANPTLITMLEALRSQMNAKAIIINSGYRCPTHDKRVGGSGSGAHTLGYAADIKVQKQDLSYYKSFTIAEQAEKLGFGGIGVGLGDGVSCHVDVRHIGGYANSHWFGNEQTGETYNTFKGMGETINTDGSTTPAKKTLEVIFDGRTLFKGDVSL